MSIPTLFFTPPADTGYDPRLLDRADKKRLAAAPHLAGRQDWRSSRYLKQHLPQPRPPYSLAHKNGYAVLFCTGASAVGVDMEYLQKRDFAALLPWFCTTAEQNYFHRCPDKTLAFYRLWTLKEALLKALNRDFADIKSLGTTTLPPPGKHWQQWVCLADDRWLITAVAATEQPLPKIRISGFSAIFLPALTPADIPKH